MEIEVKRGAINAGKFKDALMVYVEQCMKAEPETLFYINIGERFAKVVHDFGAGDSCFCFVEISTGDIYKTGTWHQPQKNGKRGNIYTNKLPLTTKEFYVR